jgi:hypothetical protein
VGSHHSAWVPQPSTKITDPDNIALPEMVSAGYKHKAAAATTDAAPASCHRIHDMHPKSILDNDLSDQEEVQLPTTKLTPTVEQMVNKRPLKVMTMMMMTTMLRLHMSTPRGWVIAIM